jgi:hypothetical protein
MIITEKSGVIEFKSQKDIIADRQKRTKQQYQELQKRVGKIIQNNYHLAQSVKIK